MNFVKCETKALTTDRCEKNLANLQLAVNTQDRKKRCGNKGNRIFANVVRNMSLSQEGVHQAAHSKNFQNVNLPMNQYIYTDYTQHNYIQAASGKWCFNPYSSARNVPTLDSDMKVLVTTKAHVDVGMMQLMTPPVVPPVVPPVLPPIIPSNAIVSDVASDLLRHGPNFTKIDKLEI